MERYEPSLKLAPIILLKLLPKGAFGSWGTDHGRTGRAAMASDVTMVLSVVVGGIAALVLGDVVAPTATARWIVVLVGCLSLLLLGAHMLRTVTSLYRARPNARGLAISADGYAEPPRERR